MHEALRFLHGTGQRVLPHPHDHFLARLHQFAELAELILVEELPGRDEHLPFLFLDMMFHEVLQHLRLRLELVRLRVCRHERRELDIDQVMLLGRLIEEIRVLRLLGRRLEGGVEDFLLDLRMRLELALDLRAETLALPHIARRIQLPQEPFHRGVVRLQHRNRIRHRCSSLCVRKKFIN